MLGQGRGRWAVAQILILIREFVEQSRDTLVGDHFLYSCNLNVWSRGEMIRRNQTPVTLKLDNRFVCPCFNPKNSIFFSPCCSNRLFLIASNNFKIRSQSFVQKKNPFENFICVFDEENSLYETRTCNLCKKKNFWSIKVLRDGFLNNN